MAGSRRTRGVTPRSLASFDADTPPVPPEIAEPTATPPTAPVPPTIRLEASSIRSLEVRRNGWIRERFARERRRAAETPDAAPPS